MHSTTIELSERETGRARRPGEREKVRERQRQRLAAVWTPLCP